MARTIGRKNKALIRMVFRSMTKRTPWGEVETPSEGEVIEKLPVELWEIWEGADTEIRNIIRDIRMNDKSKLKKVM